MQAIQAVSVRRILFESRIGIVWLDNNNFSASEKPPSGPTINPAPSLNDSMRRKDFVSLRSIAENQVNSCGKFFKNSFNEISS